MTNELVFYLSMTIVVFATICVRFMHQQTRADVEALARRVRRLENPYGEDDDDPR